ncbi:MAG: TIGR03617 family F420-dependent LLM class oxidoreductase [Acidobacteria bacterium]|nr:TIGR03617 family F420-dependent LLM class oxidoreductase [Acidobacteriota bacterium]
MAIYTTLPTSDPASTPETFAQVEKIGYDGAFSFEAAHDPFLPLAAATGTTNDLLLGTAVAIAFARNPMILANLGYDLQQMSRGRFILGLGSQIKPHIERRFSEQWSRPVERMRELVLAVKSIWASWQNGTVLDVRGEFYRHDLMVPAFDPGPNPYGSPPVFIGGVGPRMTEVAAEVAEGLLVHPFHTRRSLETITRPALQRGLDSEGKSTDRFEVVCVTMVVCWDDDESKARALRSLRDQIAFYGSTPAYRPVLETAGHDDLHAELNAMSKRGEWDEMSKRIPLELMEQVAVLGRREEIADRLIERLDNFDVSVSLVNSRNPDPGHFADIVADLKGRDAFGAIWSERSGSA